MPGELIDGGAVAQAMLSELAPEVEALTAAGHPPHLVAIRANDDPGTGWYAKAQAKHCESHGIHHTVDDLGPDASEADILAAIERHNTDPAVSAILLFLPLPPGVDALTCTTAIRPEKDAEGVHPTNLGTLLATGSCDPAPCTAMAAVELVRRIRPELNGARALVMGRSAIVGKPAALLLLNLNASPMIGHSRSDVKALARDADVVIAATGAAQVKWQRYRKALRAFKKGKGEKPAPVDLTPLITADCVKPGAIVIDVGVNHIPAGVDAEGNPKKNDKGKTTMRYVGDVDVDAVREVAAYVTSAKGGVGPVTNAYLLRNTVHAARAHA